MMLVLFMLAMVSVGFVLGTLYALYTFAQESRLRDEMREEYEAMVAELEALNNDPHR